MTDPYRDAPGSEAPEAPRDRGIVGDVIAQFADPYAFYRELIQNSIDAGSPEIGVELTYDRDAQRMRAAVRDRGEGMTREIIENQLLVLFRSTKEKDTTKIGKFGIGFSSVLAPDPEVVIITSARGGKRLTCHLYRDLTYELFDSGRATQAGTTVELEILMTPERVEPFFKASEHALVRWCRHASVPIALTITDRERRKPRRIDRALDIEGSVLEVSYTTDDGQLTVLAGITRNARPYLGLFNHGLMLAELDESPLGNLSVKIQDSRLGHTLSRDNVRRDAHYHHAINVAREVIADKLRARVAARLHELAEDGTDATYREFLDAVVRSEIVPIAWHFPLLEPRGDAKSISAGDIPSTAWAGDQRSALTAAVAGQGEIVLRATDIDLLRRAMRQAGGTEVREIDSELTVASPIDLTDNDAALVHLLGELLGHAHRAPAGILLVELEGARADMLSVGLGQETTRLFDQGDANKNPFAFFGRRTLALSIAHPHVKAARAADDPVLAAAHLARAVLLQHRLLDANRSKRIVERALAAIGVTV